MEQSMNTVFQILESIETTKGTNAKNDILSVHKDNDLLKKTLVYSLNPYIVFNVSKFKKPKTFPYYNEEQHPPYGGGDSTLQSFLNLLDKLSSRELTGNAARTAVEEFFSKIEAFEAKWCERILLRNIRLGISTTSINKICPNLIPEFSVALAQSLKSDFVSGEGIVLLEPVNYPVWVEPKLDGLRCIAIKSKGKTNFYTRNGKQIDTLPSIAEELDNCGFDDFVLDGEIMSNTNTWNDSISVVMSHKTQKDDSNMVFHVFDWLPLNEWESQTSKYKQYERYNFAQEVVSGLTRCKQVEGKLIDNDKDLKTYFATCMDSHYEGVMLKDPSKLYSWGRSKNILKLKPIATFEGVVTGIVTGRTGSKLDGLFAGFEVTLPNGIMTKVGSGFNDEFRANMKTQSETWLGKIIELEGQPDPMTDDGLSVDGKIRFPVFVRERALSDVDHTLVALAESLSESQ